MTELRIRNVDEWVVEWHRTSAKKRGVSLEAELKRVLADAISTRRRTTAKKLSLARAELKHKYGTFPSSTDAIRQMREGLE